MRELAISYTSTYIYDTTTNSWTTGLNTNVPHSITGGTAIGNLLLVVAGFDGTGDTNVVESILLSSLCGTPTLGNYPDTSLPLSTDTTVTPDAPPTNTTSINVSTSTNFNGTLEGDPVTGVVRVTNAHPAETYTVTVTAFNGGGLTATTTFALTVTTPVTCTPVSFAAATNFGAGNTPVSIAVGESMPMAKKISLLSNLYYRQCVDLVGRWRGSFSAQSNFGHSIDPHIVAVGDFNGDGNQDLAVSNNDSNDVSILLGDGDGNFSCTTNVGAGINP